MKEIATPDGHLARDPESGGLALALDKGSLSEEAVNALTSDRAVGDPSVYLPIGRSALGIVTGIDITCPERPAVCRDGDGSVLVPIEVTAHATPGETLLSRLYNLAEDHYPGQKIRWDGHLLDFGRLLYRGGLEQLSDDELDTAASEHLIAFGDNYPQGEAEPEIEDGMLSLPIEPWELVLKEEVLNDPRRLRFMLQAGQSARAFAFGNTHAEPRSAQHYLAGFAVGAVLFSSGPFYCEMVDAVSSQGTMPQIPSAAWLDANRSLGLHPDQLPGHRGRQFEVADPDPNSGSMHPWLETRLRIKVFRPRHDLPEDSIARFHTANWEAMTLEERQRAHHFGYGVGV